MIQIECVLGQAGSGKSTFIKQMFDEEEHIFFNVGSILRKMFGSSLGKRQEDSKNTWSFADPLVYNIFDNCYNISRNYNIPLVSDGFPRNLNQLDYINTKLRVAEYGPVKINMHLLDISEKEQLRRILKRNGELTEYHVDRVAESRENFECVITRLESILLKDSENLRYNLNWYKQENGTFIKVSTNTPQYK
tara:strand:- start:38 stop:613 length:576 start_codon:yes stop_codon:yes gene_type:complete